MKTMRVAGLMAGALVALVAGIASYTHMRELAAQHGETWLSYMLPLSVDGLLVVASLVIVGFRRAGGAAPRLAWVALVTGVIASLAANIANAGDDPVSKLVAAWPPMAFAVTFELVLQLLRGIPAEMRQVSEPVDQVAPHQVAVRVAQPEPVVEPPAVRDGVSVAERVSSAVKPAPPAAFPVTAASPGAAPAAEPAPPAPASAAVTSPAAADTSVPPAASGPQRPVVEHLSPAPAPPGMAPVAATPVRTPARRTAPGTERGAATAPGAGPATAPDGTRPYGDLVVRARDLLVASEGRIGRGALARQLGCSEHQARQLLAILRDEQETLDRAAS